MKKPCRIVLEEQSPGLYRVVGLVNTVDLHLGDTVTAAEAREWCTWPAVTVTIRPTGEVEAAGQAEDATPVAEVNPAAGDAVTALARLGISKADARRRVAAAIKRDGPGLGIEDLVKAALET